MEYFTYNNEKIYIEFTNEGVIFKKEVNGNLVKLSELEEKELLDNLKPKDPYILQSARIENIAKNNPSLNANYDYFLSFLNYIEGIIPENYKENFYKNLESITIDLDDKGINNENNLGCYNAKLNKIVINSKKIRESLQSSNTLSDDTYWKAVNTTLIHELYHVASTHYDKETGIMLSGFDKLSNNVNDSNVGLNEGFTDVLTYAAMPDAPDYIFGYVFEDFIAAQLTFVVSPEIMIESYFGNHGTSLLVDKLCDIKNDKTSASSLFTLIDLNFFMPSGEQTLLGTIQSRLVEYFKLKILNDIKSGVTEEEINSSITNFKSVLITNNLLNARGMDPSNYPNLNESIESFSKFEEEVKEMLSTHVK